MTQLEDDLLDLEPGDSLEKGRTGLLTGLCITSWVGCGLVFISSGFSLIRMDWGMMESEYLWQIVPNLIFVMVCALGVFGMWNLKRWGLYVYLLGELAPVGLSIWLFYKYTSPLIPDYAFTQILFSLSGIISYGIPLIFSGMYISQYKHLK